MIKYKNRKGDFYEPYPKNPKIAKVFKEIGLADELGSGVRNMYKYTKIYSGGVPELKEDDIFRAYIPLIASKNGYTNDHINDHINVHLNDNISEYISNSLTENEIKVLKVIKENSHITHIEMANKIHVSEKTVRRITKKLKEKGIIKRVGANKNGYWEIIKPKGENL